jgi:hypothetical protein
MAKPPKTPRPEKPPFLPFRKDHAVSPRISDAQKIRIGTVIERWSKLEATMDDLIWTMLKLRFEVGRLITNRMDTTGKIRLLRQAGSFVLSEEQFHRLSPIVDQIDILREDRNFIAHGSWGTLMPENVPICSSVRPNAKNPDEVAAETFPPERIEAIASEIESLKLRLIPLRNELETSPHIPCAWHDEG